MYTRFMKLTISVLILLLSIGCNAIEYNSKYKSYPWGTRTTYLDGVIVSAKVLDECTFYYLVRNNGIVQIHNSNNFISYWIAGRLQREEAESFITVFCGFTKIRHGKPPKILGKGTFSSPAAAMRYKENLKK